MFVSHLEQHQSRVGTDMGWLLLLLYREVGGKDRNTRVLHVGQGIHLFYVEDIFPESLETNISDKPAFPCGRIPHTSTVTHVRNTVHAKVFIVCNIVATRLETT